MAPSLSPTRRTGLRSLLALLTLLLVATACAASPTVTVTREPTAAELAAADEAAKRFEATPVYLARVQQRTNDAGAMRFEVFTSVETPLFNMGSRTTPISTGELTQGRSRVFVDLGPLMGPMGGLGGLDSNSMTMTMVTDEEALYLNAPFFAEMMAATGEGGSEYDWMDQLAAGWGRIDLSGAKGSDILNELGIAGGAGGEDVLALLGSVGAVLDGGRDEVRGVGVNVAYADVTVADILEASGESLADLGVPRSERDALQELTANVAVSIDDEGMVRRVEYRLDLGRLLGDADPSQQLDMVMWQRVDFYDFGADIEVSLPFNSVDVTDDFKDLLDELN